MGSHMSVKRQDPVQLSPYSHSDAENYVLHTESRVRRIENPINISHPRADSNPQGHSRSNQNHQPCTTLRRIFAELENNILYTEDAQLIRRIFEVQSSATSSTRRTIVRIRNAQSESSTGDERRIRLVNSNHTPSFKCHSTRQVAPLHGRQFQRNRLNSCLVSGERGRNTEVSLSRQRSDRKSIRLTTAARQALNSILSSIPQNRSMTDKIYLLIGQDKRCVFCKRLVPPDDYLLHFSVYFDHPRVAYNEEKISVEKGECPICLEDLKPGDSIARLPCLCIYHKGCIDDWFAHKQTCPEHPDD